MDILIQIFPVATLLLGFFIGYRMKDAIPRPTKKEISEKELRDQERVSKHFQQLMQYDVNKATRRRSLI